MAKSKFGIKDIPIDKLRDLVSEGKDLDEKRSELVRVAIFVDPASPRELVGWIKDAFDPQMPSGRVHVELLAEDVGAAVNAETDLAIVLAGGSDALVRAVAEGLAAAGVRYAVVAESALDVPELPEREGSRAGIVAATSADVLLDKLASWLIDASDKDLALAANFPFVRKPAAEKAVKATAGQNAVVGALPILPGADMPVMTANQMKMALQIAAIYGHAITPERVPELLGIAGGAVVARGIARGALGLVPGVGWAIKGGMGYAGTLAMGNAIIARFELGDDPEAFRDAAQGAAEGFAGRLQEAGRGVGDGAAQLSAQLKEGASQFLGILADRARSVAARHGDDETER